ncbi:MAG: universal stress protein [Haloferacaceae archaeon]
MHVLLAYDGSEPADDALDLAVTQLAPDRLTALYVFDPDETAAEDPEDPARERASEVLPAVERRVDGAAEVETVHAVGDPADEVVAHSESRDVDHVVLGSHGRQGMSRLLVGSVAEAVVRGSPVPVTVAR